jgi:hypothetical protein
MKFLSRLERRFRDYAVVNLTLYLVAIQGFVAVVCMARPEFMDRLILDHDRLFAGEWWRLFTVPFIPPPVGPFWMVIELFFLYVIGSSLELHWGTFRYNFYLLVGYLATLLAVLVPDAEVTNLCWMGSILLAFGWLYPDTIFLLFFIFPCKAKWLALAAWIYYLVALLDYDWGTKAQVVAGIGTFLLFFHREVFESALTARRKFRNQMAEARKHEAGSPLPVHQCVICGANQKMSPWMEFRYCPQCTGTPCYCMEHIMNHVHR